jgi:hypothetical protein
MVIRVTIWDIKTLIGTIVIQFVKYLKRENEEADLFRPASSRTLPRVRWVRGFEMGVTGWNSRSRLA